MLIIAERINATRSRIARALRQRDAAVIAREARVQTEAGASYIDVNAGAVPAREIEDLEWAVGIVRQSTDLPLCIDSPNPAVLRRGLELLKGGPAMINSVTGEAAKMKAVLPLAAEFGCLLVALAMDDRGLPETAQKRVEIASKIVKAAEAHGVERARIYLDPCIQPLSTSPAQAEAVRAAVGEIMRALPGVHTTCGLSNISFGLPDRALLNRTYLACLIAAGLDSAIVDPTAEGIMDTVRAAEALAGRDEYCIEYIRALRSRPT